MEQTVNWLTTEDKEKRNRTWFWFCLSVIVIITIMSCLLFIIFKTSDEKATAIKVKETAEELPFGSYDIQMLSPDNSTSAMIEKINLSRKTLKVYCTTDFKISKACLNTLYTDLTSVNARDTTGIFYSEGFTILVFPNFPYLRSRTLRLTLYPSEKNQIPIETFVEISKFRKEELSVE